MLFSVGPAAAHWNLEAAAGWARVVLLAAALQTAYLAWMLLAPDWSTVRAVMVVFAAGATGAAVATAAILFAPRDLPLPLGVEPVRHWLPAWLAAVLAVQGLGAYLCGRLSFRWQEQLRRLSGRSP